MPVVSAGESIGGRRPAGSLEHEVLTALWSAEAALTPGEVQEALGADLAYTTVMTTLTRLYGKGLVQRTRAGRAYAYSPVERAAEHAAQTMTDVLSQGSDRAAVLTRFVERLGPDEEAVLRRLLDPSEDV